MITLTEMKQYLRVDTSDDDELITNLISAGEKLCQDVARLSDTEFEENSLTTRIAVLYAVAYLYEHREEADHHQLTLNLKNLLFGVREAKF